MSLCTQQRLCLVGSRSLPSTPERERWFLGQAASTHILNQGQVCHCLAEIVTLKSQSCEWVGYRQGPKAGIKLASSSYILSCTFISAWFFDPHPPKNKTFKKFLCRWPEKLRFIFLLSCKSTPECNVNRSRVSAEWQTMFIIQPGGQLNLDSTASFKLLCQIYHDQSCCSPMDGC